MAVTRIQALYLLQHIDTNHGLPTREQINSNYRKLALCHPDRIEYHPHTSAEERKKIFEANSTKFKLHVEAKEYLIQLLDKNPLPLQKATMKEMLEILEITNLIQGACTPKEDAYKDLGFDISIEPSEQEIKFAYWREANKWHPDKNAARAHLNKQYDEIYNNDENFIKVALALQYFNNKNAFLINLPSSRDYQDLGHFARELFTAYNSQLQQANDKPYFIDITEQYLSFSDSCRVAFESEQEFSLYCAHRCIRSSARQLTINNFQLPENGSEIFLQALLNMPYITKVNASAGFFKQEQQLLLNAYLQKNIKANRTNNKIPFRNRNNWKDNFNFIMSSAGICAIAGCGLYELSILFFNPTIVIGSIMAAMAGCLFGINALIDYRDKYIKDAFKKYNSIDKINEVEDPVEKEALVAGLEAKTYTGYFNSFRLRCAYQRPKAFYAGYAHAMEGNTKCENSIRAMKP